MSSRSRSLVSFAAVCLAVVALTAGCATPPPDPTPPAEPPPEPPMPFEPCVAAAIELDASAWREHARDLREMIVATRPEYEAIATLGTSMRLAEVDRRERRMRWLLDHDPARLTIDAGTEEFRVFAWAEPDSAALAEADPAIAERSARAAELAAQYGSSPGLAQFVEWYNSELVDSVDYRASVADLIDRERAVERQLARCLPRDADVATDGDGAAGDDAGDD